MLHCNDCMEFIVSKEIGANAVRYMYSLLSVLKADMVDRGLRVYEPKMR